MGSTIAPDAGPPPVNMLAKHYRFSSFVALPMMSSPLLLPLFPNRLHCRNFLHGPTIYPTCTELYSARMIVVDVCMFLLAVRPELCSSMARCTWSLVAQVPVAAAADL